MQKMQPEFKRKTLRDFGFEECQHPDGSLAYNGGQQHCGYCGAIRVGDSYTGGSVDYKIDNVVLRLRRADLEKNLLSY